MQRLVRRSRHARRDRTSRRSNGRARIRRRDRRGRSMTPRDPSPAHPMARAGRLRRYGHKCREQSPKRDIVVDRDRDRKSVTSRRRDLAMLGCVTHPATNTLLWTLEEISHLVSNSGHPDETLDNIVQLIQRTLRHRRLLGVSARARSRDARARCDDRPPPGQRRTGAHAAVGRSGRPRRRAAEASGGRRCHQAPAIQVFQRGGRRPVSLVPRRAAHRSRACCRVCSSCRRSSRGCSAPTPCAC